MLKVRDVIKRNYHTRTNLQARRLAEQRRRQQNNNGAEDVEALFGKKDLMFVSGKCSKFIS